MINGQPPHSRSEAGTAELLEIYHARQLRRTLAAQIARLAEEPPKLPVPPSAERDEVRAYYFSLLALVDELRQRLGDRD